MEVDEVFGHIGELGPAQVKLFVMLSLPIGWMALHVLVTSFIGTDPGWECSAVDTNSPRNCSGMNTECTSSAVDMPTALITDPVEKCRRYESGDCMPQFNTDYTSIVTEWELICSRSSYPNLSQSGYFLGLMLGAWLFGSLADMYGRKKVLFATLLGSVLMGLGYGLSTGFVMFAICRLLFGMMTQATIVVGYTLLLEVVGASKRSLVATLTQTFFPVGLCVLVILAYFIRNWRILCVLNSLIGLGFLALWRLIPESPRWLLVQGREEQAMAVLARIASGNGRQMTNTKLKSPAPSQAPQSSVSVADLFRGHVIRKRTLILLAAWFTNCIVYYGLSLNASSLGGGRYLSLVLSGFIEIPGLYVGYQLVNRIGRKWTHGGLLMLGGICCVAWAMSHWTGLGESVGLVLSLLGKCAVAGSFCIIYLYTAELFPTEVRSLGMGVVSVASRLGGILSPILLLLSSVSVSMPMVVMGCLGLSAGFLTLHLPETLNLPLPETLAELNSQ